MEYDKSRGENQKKYRVFKKDYIWNPATCSCKNGKYLASVLNDSVITCDEIMKETKTVSKNFNEEKVACKIKKILDFTQFLINFHRIIDSL